jgi:hypothetical protein
MLGVFTPAKKKLPNSLRVVRVLPVKNINFVKAIYIFFASIRKGLMHKNLNEKEV